VVGRVLLHARHAGAPPPPPPPQRGCRSGKHSLHAPMYRLAVRLSRATDTNHPVNQITTPCPDQERLAAALTTPRGPGQRSPPAPTVLWHIGRAQLQRANPPRILGAQPLQHIQRARCRKRGAAVLPRQRPAPDPHAQLPGQPASLLPRLLIVAVACPAPHSHVSCFAFTHTLPPPSLALGPAAVLAILPVLSRLTPSCARPHTPFLTPSASDGACPGGAQRQLDGAARE